MNGRAHYIILSFFIILAFFLRFFELGKIPYGFYQDESAIGYNAYSIIETGKDERGNFLPLYFKSFGDYKLPVYIYSTIIPIKVLGLNEFAVRFPSAFFGFLTVVLFYIFIKQISGSRDMALVGTILLALNPWHLHYSRATFEVSISLFLFILGGVFLHSGFVRKNINYFLAGTLCFIVSLYSYNLTRLLSPVLYLLFILYYRKHIKLSISKVVLLKAAVPIILLIPFFVTAFQSGGMSSAAGTIIFSSAKVKAPLIELRSYFMESPVLFAKIFFNQVILIFWQYVSNIASYLSPSFLFISGSSHGNHGIGNVGQFYLFEMPFILLGIYTIISKKVKWAYLFVFWAAVVILIASLTRDVPHATRSFFLIVPLIVFSACGFVVFISWLKKLEKKEYEIAVLSAVTIFIFYNIVYYFTSYYIKFPVEYSSKWRSEDKAVSLYISASQQNYNKIVFDQEAGFIYTSFLFFAKYSPLQFQKTAVFAPADSEGFSNLLSFDKYEFRNIDWEKDIKSKNTLIVTNQKQKPEKIFPLKIFYYPKKSVFFAVKQEIIGYPVEEDAYVLIETE